MLRVLIADDHAVVRRGLRQILAAEFPDAHFGEADNGSDALELCLGQLWDLIILDIWMPGLGGLSVLKELRARGSGTPVLVLSIYPETEYGVRVLRLGASGYLTKSSAVQDLVEAVRQVLQGGKFLSSRLAGNLAMGSEGDERHLPHEVLSNREYEVLKHIGLGKSLTEVARELSLSPKTVGTYRSRILGKMKYKTTAQLVKYALKHGLAE